MLKVAPTDYPIHDLLRDRWSPRAFSDRPVPPEVLCSLFEAARWAASSANEQPWAFLVATRDDPEAHARLLSVLAETNQFWAKHAPVLAVALAQLDFARTGQPNRNALYDTGQAVADLTVEATSRGLFVHQMAGFDPQKTIELYQVPQGWQPISAFVIGYYGNPQSLPENLRERERAPRSRKPLSRFIMSDRWGHPAPFVESKVSR